MTARVGAELMMESTVWPAANEQGRDDEDGDDDHDDGR